MNNFKNWLIIIQTLIIIFLILLFQKCRPSPAGVNSYITRIDSFYRDTGIHTLKTIDKPVPYLVEVPVISRDSIPKDPDDSLYFTLLQEYGTKRYYSDSLADSNINVMVNYFVYRNEPGNMRIDYRWKKPLIQITYLPVQKPKNSLWLSHQVTFWQKWYIGTDIGLNVKGRSIYAIGANLPITGSDRQVYFRYGYRIGK